VWRGRKVCCCIIYWSATLRCCFILVILIIRYYRYSAFVLQPVTWPADCYCYSIDGTHILYGILCCYLVHYCDYVWYTLHIVITHHGVIRYYSIRWCGVIENRPHYYQLLHYSLMIVIYCIYSFVIPSDIIVDYCGIRLTLLYCWPILLLLTLLIHLPVICWLPVVVYWYAHLFLTRLLMIIVFYDLTDFTVCYYYCTFSLMNDELYWYQYLFICYYSDSITITWRIGCYCYCYAFIHLPLDVLLFGRILHVNSLILCTRYVIVRYLHVCLIAVIVILFVGLRLRTFTAACVINAWPMTW